MTGIGGRKSGAQATSFRQRGRTTSKEEGRGPKDCIISDSGLAADNMPLKAISDKDRYSRYGDISGRYPYVLYICTVREKLSDVDFSRAGSLALIIFIHMGDREYAAHYHVEKCGCFCSWDPPEYPAMTPALKH